MSFDKAAYWEQRQRPARDKKFRDAQVFICPECKSPKGTLAKGKWICASCDYGRRGR